METMTPARRRWTTSTWTRAGLIAVWSEVIAAAVAVLMTHLDAAWWPPLALAGVVMVTAVVAVTMGWRAPRG